MARPLPAPVRFIEPRRLSAPTSHACSEPLGAVLIRSPSRELLLRPGERTTLGQLLFEHVEHAVEVRELDSSAGLRVFGARVAAALVRPPTIVEGDGSTFTVVSAPSLGHEVAKPLPGLIGKSSPMLRLSAQVRRYAAVSLPVLLRGESGTGKDIVARALHDLSPRQGPFVAINAATISRDLAESELFGHNRGAFTGATSDRRGAFREAHGGTLLIDEIAALGLEIQAKLLRVVEDGMVRPLGGERSHAVDVRLVVATCEPLEEMVDARRFREDLYERLAVCIAFVPSLGERPEDIPLLAEHLLKTCALEREIAPQALHLLMSRRYRGNVRELRNVLAQAALRTDTGRIEAAHVSAVFEERDVGRRRVSPAEAQSLLEAYDGNISAVARHAKLPRSTLRDLLRRNRDDDAVEMRNGGPPVDVGERRHRAVVLSCSSA